MVSERNCEKFLTMPRISITLLIVIYAGSGGDFFSPHQTKNNPITLFSSDLRRPLQLYFTEEQDFNGVNVFKYSITERSLDNGTHEDNQCFAPNKATLLSGVMNISSCYYGAPLFASLPHFYTADPIYLASYTDEIGSSVDNHSFYVLLEANTGIPVETVARIQINIYVQKHEDIALYQDVATMFFPAIWIEQRVRISDETFAELKMLKLMLEIGYIGSGVVIVIGALLLLVVGYRRLKKPKTEKEKNSTKNVDTSSGSIK